MNRDLGCVEMVYVPYEELASTGYEYGLLFVHKDQTGRGGCWSALGRRPGFTGGIAGGDMRTFGALRTWQLIQLEEMCGGKETGREGNRD